MTRRALSEAGPARGAGLRKASRSLAALQTSPHERRGRGALCSWGCRVPRKDGWARPAHLGGH